MRMATVCSGIGAPELAGLGCGVESVWCSEIEAFPSAVLAARFPETVNLGDMTGITKEVAGGYGAIDILVGGTPCQSFSVAGLRGGLMDPRGNLCLEYLRLVDLFRPRWFVWENVPGVLSSNGGRDFGTFLGAVGQLGYSFAYRVLDARYFGVAQRRRRVFVVGHFGDWAAAGAVLFERAGVRGDIAACGAAGKAVAGTLGGGSGSRGWPDDLDRRGAGHDASEDGTGRGNPLVVNAEGGEWCRTASNGAKCVNNQTPLVLGVGVNGGEVSHCLRSNGSRSGDKGDGGMNAPVAVAPGAVRRLTPREWERLQGFPDDWTLVEYRGRPAADSPRYRAIGNSMAVPVMRWILGRVRVVDGLMVAA